MARYPKAEWHGPVPNEANGMGAVRLFVVHIEQGTENGTDGWFHNPAAQVSAHFGVAKDGTVLQWVDTADVAWAEENYNYQAISIEHEGVTGSPLTAPQLAASLELLSWLHTVYPQVPLRRTTNALTEGVIGHGELGVAGGDHLQCPGNPVLAQFNKALRPSMVGQPQTPAGGGSGPPVPTPAPVPKGVVLRPPGPIPVLYRGMSEPKDWIAYAHYKLKMPLPRLGGFGRLTYNAVIRVQEHYGLATDGVMGPQTWGVLGVR